MVTELKDFVPGLHTGFCEPGQSEPTALGKFVVPKNFVTVFMFEDFDKKTKKWLDGDHWEVIFRVSVSDLGTPVLDGLEMYGSITRWKLKLIEQYRYTLLELALKIVVSTRKPRFMLEEEYDLETVAVLRAITEMGTESSNPILMELPTHLKGVPTKFVRYWDGKAEPLNATELKDLTKTINTTLRKRITPEYLQHIATIYIQAVRDGKKPIHAIMDSERVEHRTASDYSSKARKLGLLPETRPGVVTIDKPTNKKGKR